MTEYRSILLVHNLLLSRNSMLLIFDPNLRSKPIKFALCYLKVIRGMIYDFKIYQTEHENSWFITRTLHFMGSLRIGNALEQNFPEKIQS